MFSKITMARRRWNGGGMGIHTITMLLALFNLRRLIPPGRSSHLIWFLCPPEPRPRNHSSQHRVMSSDVRNGCADIGSPHRTHKTCPISRHRRLSPRSFWPLYSTKVKIYIFGLVLWCNFTCIVNLSKIPLYEISWGNVCNAFISLFLAVAALHRFSFLFCFSPRSSLFFLFLPGSFSSSSRICTTVLKRRLNGRKSDSRRLLMHLHEIFGSHLRIQPQPFGKRYICSV